MKECTQPTISALSMTQPGMMSATPSPRAAYPHEQGEVRPVPLHPDLVALLRRHIDEFGIAPDGRIFRSATGGPVRMSTYLTVWRSIGPAPARSLWLGGRL